MLVSLVLFAMSLWIAGECKGIESVQPVVFGGEVISVQEAPFIALYISILMDNLNREMKIKCGANIITEKFLLSAAHCAEDKSIDQFVIVGTDIGYLDQSNAGGKVNIQKVIKHPKYDDSTLTNDVLVIKLAKSLQFSSRVQPIKMESHGAVVPENSMLQTYGYGLSESNGPSRLRKANVPFIDKHACKTQFLYNPTINHKTICAGIDGRVSCQGDSGGPLVYNNNLVGLTSFGLSKCGLGPAVYTRVGAFRSFIDQTIKSNS